MPTYLHPGVYIEEVAGGARPIEGVATSVAVFLGHATKGPENDPTVVTSWEDYQNTFGGISTFEIATSGDSPVGDPMGHSVYSFFLNGGGKAYIVRLTEGSQASRGYANHPVEGTEILVFEALSPGEWGNELVIQLSNESEEEGVLIVKVGTGSGEEPFVALEQFSDVVMNSNNPNYIENKVNDGSSLVQVSVQNVAHFKVGTSTSAKAINPEMDFMALNSKSFTVVLNDDEENAVTVTFAEDAFNGDSTPATVAAAIQAAVFEPDHEPRQHFSAEIDGGSRKLVLKLATGSNDSKVVVQAAEAEADDASAALTLGKDFGGTERTGAQTLAALLTQASDSDPVEITFASGLDGNLAGSEDYVRAFTLLEKVRGINIVCLPGQWKSPTGGAHSIIDAAISHCEKMKNRMVIYDLEPATAQEDPVTAAALDDITSSYAATYYPWSKVANPHYDADTNPGAPTRVLVPPSGFAAGMWAKIDGSRGVWKAPAGVETNLRGISALERDLGNKEQDELNPAGINVMRRMTGYGNVIWGARTRATKTKPEWRYVPVRRTAMYIEESIYNGIQWAVFEPNDHRLWSALRLNIEAFMDGLFRAGAFQGETANKAYFVQCGLGQTMKQSDIDAGQVIVVVGFAPVKPAEFVIIRIKQMVGES